MKPPTHFTSLHCVRDSIVRGLNYQGHAPYSPREKQIFLKRLKSQNQGHITIFMGPGHFSLQGPFFHKNILKIIVCDYIYMKSYINIK